MANIADNSFSTDWAMAHKFCSQFLWVVMYLTLSSRRAILWLKCVLTTGKHTKLGSKHILYYFPELYAEIRWYRESSKVTMTFGLIFVVSIIKHLRHYTLTLTPYNILLYTFHSIWKTISVGIHIIIIIIIFIDNILLSP